VSHAVARVFSKMYKEQCQTRHVTHAIQSASEGHVLPEKSKVMAQMQRLRYRGRQDRRQDAKMFEKEREINLLRSQLAASQSRVASDRAASALVTHSTTTADVAAITTNLMAAMRGQQFAGFGAVRSPHDLHAAHAQAPVVPQPVPVVPRQHTSAQPRSPVVHLGMSDVQLPVPVVPSPTTPLSETDLVSLRGLVSRCPQLDASRRSTILDALRRNEVPTVVVERLWLWKGTPGRDFETFAQVWAPLMS